MTDVDRDAWLGLPQPTPEMCRLIHGIDCRRCVHTWPNNLDRLVRLVEIGQLDTPRKGRP